MLVFSAGASPRPTAHCCYRLLRICGGSKPPPYGMIQIIIRAKHPQFFILHFSFCPRTYGIALVAQCKRQKRYVQKNISFPFYNSDLFFQKMHCDSGGSESGGAYSHLFKRGDYGLDARRSIGIDKVLYLIVNILYALYVLVHCGICCECI